MFERDAVEYFEMHSVGVVAVATVVFVVATAAVVVVEWSAKCWLLLLNYDLLHLDWC